ncbi:MAG: alpha/beta fold hydrolase [Syntrophomonas sp.]
MPDYARLDHPVLQQLLFYPRNDHDQAPPGAFDYPVPVDEGVHIVCRFYTGQESWPWLIYFHGNGEVACDYDYIAPFYTARRMNLVVADYRGYGSSSGQPGFAHLINDAHIIFKALTDEIKRRSPSSPLLIMGRSLGSTSALELAYSHQNDIKGLIIESGFTSVTRLVKHLGLPAPGIDLATLENQCLDMIAAIKCPCLIIHGEYDNLVPVGEGQIIMETLPGPDKNFVLIPGAGHNDVIFARPELYFSAIEDFVYRGLVPKK